MHTSITECCFRNMVDMMISVVRVRDAAFTNLLSRSLSQFVSDMWIARELNTWILGRIFVGVSVL